MPLGGITETIPSEGGSVVAVPSEVKVPSASPTPRGNIITVLVTKICSKTTTTTGSKFPSPVPTPHEKMIQVEGTKSSSMKPTVNN